MSEKTVRVTDHAVLRYMERAMNLNVEIVRQHIENVCKGPASIGATAVRAEGVRFEIVNGAVLTVAPDRSNPSMTGRELTQDRIQRRKREHQENRNGLRILAGPKRHTGNRSGRRPAYDPGPAGFDADDLHS